MESTHTDDANLFSGLRVIDTTAWWSRTGLADWVRRPGTPPALSAPGMGDHATAMSLFGAISAALWTRERTGEGRRVSTSLFANGIWSNGMLTLMKLCGADLPERRPELALNTAVGVQYPRPCQPARPGLLAGVTAFSRKMLPAPKAIADRRLKWQED